MITGKLNKKRLDGLIEEERKVMKSRGEEERKEEGNGEEEKD